jgi:hypothetical protein
MAKSSIEMFHAVRSVPDFEAAPADERQENCAWRQHLNDLLEDVYQNVKKDVGKQKCRPFLVAPPRIPHPLSHSHTDNL